MPVFCQRGFACGETARAVIGPAFWVCRAKSGAAFRCAKPRWPVVAPAGGNVLATPFSLRSNVAPHIPAGVCRGTFLCSTAGPALAPRRLSPFGSISLRETALAGRCPRRGQRARYPIFASLKCGPAYSRGVCRGTFLCSTAGPALAPRRKRQRPHRLLLYLQRLKRYRLQRGQLLRPAVWPG